MLLKISSLTARNDEMRCCSYSNNRRCFGRKKRCVYIASFLIFIVPSFAQTVSRLQYFYDDRGQLAKVINSSGTVIEYIYDPVGNILEIKRSTIAGGALAVLGFTPQKGGSG